MDRNTIIAFVLIGAILVIWLYLNTPETTETKQTTSTDSTTVLQADTVKTSIEDNEILEKLEKTTATEQPQDSVEQLGIFSENIESSSRIITIETDLAIYELSTLGGNFHKVYLKEFNNWYSAGESDNGSYYKNAIQLINYSVGNAYDLSFITTDGKKIDTKKLNFTSKPDSKYILGEDDSLEIEFKLMLEGGRSIVKKYKFYSDLYTIESNIELINMNGLISNNSYDIVWGSGIRFVEENSVNEANYSNASLYYGDEKVVFDAPSDGEKLEGDFNGRVDWLAVRNKYFAAVMIPSDPSSVEGAYLEGNTVLLSNSGMNEFYSASLKVPFKGTNLETKSFRLYMGPVDYDRLKGIGYNLEALVDFGSFFGLEFIVRPIAEFVLLPLFNFIHLFIPNFGFVIIIFSLIIKIVVYPLTKKSYKSMKKMQLLQPKITELKEKFKDDPQKMNKETMKLYKTYGVNPAGGCLPLLLQMPIFIALWGLFQSAIELRQQPFIMWIKDLSRPDVIYDLGFQLPLFGIQQISGLALLMGITTFAQQKMSIKDPKQQSLVYIMPVMLTILFMTFPSGLNLYYFMFNVLSIAQQYYINHKQSDVELKPVDKSKMKKGFMSRLMEAADQQSKQQQKRRK
ncbi:MAG: membrane protein insertase YidC [Ignavibacteria bacterium]|nr:membrane protein insertase YidC [Ignavibacteria bacterium]MBT8381500.1 membrane protein insertase YidC [Ignavibacteria bacterium]MBT8391562.1 membrane protein insertase YidC [Ignavibacteria bacterium]NNJ52254.1 membrane protein insertase YidC [Ignavibacteriaceae bacterium]NNL22731.1 membrane protein insertase YidC [Ignavibacteriaceae bacterium]